MSTNTRQELLAGLRQEYAGASRKKKEQLLDGFVAATRYNRKYAISLLNKASHDSVRKRNRKKVYDSEVTSALKQIWIAANCICPKRLIPFLPRLLGSMERFGHLDLDKEVRRKLLCISASTAERLLRAERNKLGKGRSLTRPGSLLRQQVAVKIFTKWDDQELGFVEIDLVAHCGESGSGQFLQTLTMTDIATGWTELAAMLCKNEILVRAALDEIVAALPFSLRGLDTDNGSEFLNHGMVSWCNDRHITFTRSRAYRKNDQAHVEEKNGSVVRRLVGYDRFAGNEARRCLAELYRTARLYINYFQPSMKLISKSRNGATVRKKYDEARTPLERLLDLPTISRKTNKALRDEFKGLDPVVLLSKMSALQKKLWDLAVAKQNYELFDGASFGIPQRPIRKRGPYVRTKETPTSKIQEIIQLLEIGTPVEAKDFYEYGSIHFVNVTLQRICERDRILARPAWGKYIRVDPRKNKIPNMRRQLRNKSK